MYIGPAEVLGADHFARSGLYQRRAGEKNRCLLTHHNGFVGHGGYIGTACGTGAHDHGNLRDARCAHVGLVEEDPSKVLAVREHLVLARQVGTPRVHQINARQAVLLGDGLRPQVFFDRQWVVRTAFDRRVVGDNHALHALDPTNAGNDPGCRNVFAVHVVSR